MYNLLVSGGMVGRFLQVVPITALVGCIYALYRYRDLRRQKARLQTGFSWTNEVIRGLFVCYLTGLINLILVPSNLWSKIWAIIFTGQSGSDLYLFSGSFNFVPSVIKCISGELTLGSWVKTMLLGNFLMFVPLGLFLPFVFPKLQKKKVFVFALIIPVFIEIIQPVIGRSFDVDDVILNFLGIMSGYLAALAIKRLITKGI